jgi:hypothetical protein
MGTPGLMSRKTIWDYTISEMRYSHWIDVTKENMAHYNF